MERIALLLGEQGEYIKDTLVKTNDSIEFRAFTTIDNFENFIRTSNTTFNRLVMSTVLVDTEGIEVLERLYAFLKENTPRTNVVFMVDERNQSGIQTIFNEIFNLAIYTDVTVTQANSKFIMECVVSSIDTLRTKYSALKIDDVTLVDEIYGNEGILNDEDFPENDSRFINVNSMPVVMDNQAVVINKKTRKRNRDKYATKANLQAELDGLIQQGYQRQLTEGYLAPDRYTFLLSDVDPSTIDYKERRISNTMRPILLNEDKTDIVKQLQPEPEELNFKEPEDQLNATGNVNLAAYFKVDLQNYTVMSEQPQPKVKFTDIMYQNQNNQQVNQQVNQQMNQQYEQPRPQMVQQEQTQQVKNKQTKPKKEKKQKKQKQKRPSLLRGMFKTTQEQYDSMQNTNMVNQIPEQNYYAQDNNQPVNMQYQQNNYVQKEEEQPFNPYSTQETQTNPYEAQNPYANNTQGEQPFSPYSTQETQTNPYEAQNPYANNTQGEQPFSPYGTQETQTNPYEAQNPYANNTQGEQPFNPYSTQQDTYDKVKQIY